ncbi:MAG: conserved phage C-terminal domain-containing protein [Berryella intestinalis]|uniref:conserved phage C-terminal domain-containing protein n=1 Tax=Berryella intestinalis TaxID=1531429 RepID=UPI002A75F842|nr:conserved phage C-terminal domain-containing protein [Berryella intestinalis]MDY3129928.1 conserved phage C-terminal domain-containing protein [Berryella intestinalis]
MCKRTGWGVRGGSFALSCLAALNDVMGTSYTVLPKSAAVVLAQCAGRYTEAEVRSMVAAKRDEWGGSAKTRKWLTPSTLFGERFEGYMETSRAVTCDDDDFSQFDR